MGKSKKSSKGRGSKGTKGTKGTKETVVRVKSKSQIDADSNRSRGRRPPSRTPSGTEFKGAKGSNARSRSGSPKLKAEPRRKPPTRSKSFGLERSLVQDQNRQKAPKPRMSRSVSPSMRLTRSRSGLSPTRQRKAPARGRSFDGGKKSGGKKSRSRSRSNTSSLDRFRDESAMKEYPSQKPEHNGVSRRRMPKSFRRIGGRDMNFTWCQVSQYVVPVMVIIGASVGLMFATGHGDIITDKIDDLIRNIENSQYFDPNGGLDAPHWPEDGHGLRVTIINALSNDWETAFSLAAADWNFGSPDAVDIKEEIGTYDPNCEAPDERVIVCNGDYGQSNWRGVNEAMLNPRGEMISSTARMNDWYLSSMPPGAWQYTMCHELGHALGLGHTDEDFDNEDLGNCMDYTNNLDVNKHPDESNYEKLLSIYGPISRRKQLRGRQLQKITSRSLSERKKYGSHLSDEDNIATSDLDPQLSVKRLRKKHPSQNGSPVENTEAKKVDVSVDVDTTARAIPDHIRHRKKAAVQKLLKRVETKDIDVQNHKPGHTHDDGWKLIHRALHGEEHEADLGEGYKVRVQLFLAH